MREYLKFYIDGQWTDPVTAKTAEVINPATEAVSGTISLGSPADVTCANNPPLFIGQQMRCEAVNADGTTFFPTVSLQRANGWITWQVDDWGVYSFVE